MRTTDIAIVGGGVAGSLAAAMLTRAGVDCVLIDPNATYPKDFRAEKFEPAQVETIRRTGLAGEVLSVATPINQLWIAKLGYFVRKLNNSQYGFAYEALVNKLRELVPNDRFIASKVASIKLSAGRQSLILSDERQVSARLVVLATGPSIGLRSALGIDRKIVSACHSVTIGFDLKPVGEVRFPFVALTYYPERAREPISCLSLFPIGDAMRANLFAYRDAADPWYAKFRAEPQATAFAAMPGLRTIVGEFDVTSEVRVRPVDLYDTSGYVQPGVALVGDAFSSSCPATGTGVGKALTDVERLCNIYIPKWLATDGMGQAKIEAFYADPEKCKTDRKSRAQALRVRSLAVGPHYRWPVRRLVKILAGSWNNRKAGAPLRHERQGN